MDKGFQVWNDHGFSIKFDNDVVVSVQFSSGNYCANRTDGWQGDVVGIDCINAEIAILLHGNYITDEFDIDKLGDGDVIGWCTPETVANAIEFAKNYNGGI